MQPFGKIIFLLSLALLSLRCGEDTNNKNATPRTCEIGEDCFIRDEAKLNVSNISEKGAQKSHNFGKNCMSCHQAKGPGKGLFQVAGSLYKDDTNPWTEGAAVKFFTDKARTQLVATVVSDALGNFYSTAPIQVPDAGLFVSIYDLNDQRLQDMGSAKISFACSACHAGLAKIIIKPKNQ